MYPDWPRSVEDLVPLPECEGPRLPAFDFKGPQEIKFLDYLGEGLHAHVLKVEIRGREYALKLFRFVYHDDWLGPYPYNDHLNLEVMSAFAKYAEPFNAECRAFARLRDEGYEELALPCFGYLLLDEHHEQLMMQQFSHLALEFNGNCEFPGGDDVRSHFPGRDGKQPPLRGIVKELGQVSESLGAKDARRILRDVIRLQQLGIIHIDVGIRQLINGKLGDFSTAVTSPHFLTSPELNPSITPEWISAMEFELFQYSINDFWAFDLMVHECNKQQGGKLAVFAFPGGYGLQPQSRRQLRSKPSRDRIYSLVDPRLFDWRRAPFTTSSAKAANGQKPKRGGQGKPSRAISKPRPRRLPARPPRWYYDCEGENAEELKTSVTFSTSIRWEFRDGFIFPRQK